MVGILAYGSLIDDPGSELDAVIRERIETETPFSVEFARKSSTTRNEAPTLIPVESGGAKVKAEVLVLEPTVTEAEATNMLYRRERHKVGEDIKYNPPKKPGKNTIVIERLTDFSHVDVVLYTRIGANIEKEDLTAEHLAQLAIQSARADAGKRGEDGISYLIDAKRNGIVTPLSTEYEEEILQQTGTKSLEDALMQCLMR